MEWNTIPFKNIDTEIFVGRYNSEEYKIEPAELRYFPSFLSEHFAKQLTEKIAQKEWENMGQDEKEKQSKEARTQELKKQILDKEISTLAPITELTMRNKVLAHEEAVRQMLLEQKERAERSDLEALKRKELEILENND